MRETLKELQALFDFTAEEEKSPREKQVGRDGDGSV